MIQRFLTPGDVDCPYTKECNKMSYEYCTECKMNAVAVKKREKEKGKKNYFKRIW